METCENILEKYKDPIMRSRAKHINTETLSIRKIKKNKTEILKSKQTYSVSELLWPQF